MADGGTLEYVAAEVIEDVYTAWEAWSAVSAYVEIALVLAASYQSYESSVRAREAYNNSLRDRYVMQRTSTGQRALVLGRARVSGPIAFMQSYGTNQSTLAIVVALAGHECDAIEKVYFNDQVVTLDGSGNVTGILSTEHFSVNSSSPLTVFLAVPAQATTIAATVTYADTSYSLTTSLAGDNLHLTLTGARAGQVGDVKVVYQPITCQYTPAQVLDQVHSLTASGTTGSYTFPANSTSYGPYIGRSGVRNTYVNGNVSAASVVVVQTIGGKQTALASTCVTDSFGNATSVSWTGATNSATIQITYQGQYNASRARVRQYLGVAGQVADPGLISNLPGEWTSAHVGNGICYVVCEFDYDQSSYSAGLPNVSATLRGAKLFDPRAGYSAWSENPAILTRGYWTHALGANVSSALVDDASVIASANISDAITQYFIGPSINPIPRPAPLYTAGYVATKDQKPQDVLTDLCMSMGGRWVITGNKLRIKAGGYTSPVASIDNSWLTGEASVTVQPLPNRQSLFNSVQGTFADETNDYRAVLYPKQVASALVTSDGRELPLDISYMAVTKTAQAQYLSSCAIRYNRAGMTVRLPCNLKAFPLEVFDVVTLTLPRFGFVAQAFEVTDTSFTPDGLLMITMKFIDPSIWAVDASYQLTTYAPKTTFPEPWNIQPPAIGPAVSGASTLLMQADGTVVSRIYVPIATSDASVANGGYIDVSYIDAASTDGNWSTVTVSGDSLGAYLLPVKDGHTYSIKARARNTLFASTWCTSIACLVVGQTAAPSGVAGLFTNNAGGNVYFFWTPNADPDYKQTVIQYGPQGTTGNAWGSAGMTQPFAAAANQYAWPSPGVGVYEFQVRHYNWSNVPTASATIIVNSPDTMSRSLSVAGSTATWGGVTGAGKPSDNATTDLVLVARGQCVVTGNAGSKTSGSNAWDSDIYSRDSYVGGAFASAVPSSTTGNTNAMFGLNSDPTTDESYTSLDYAWYLQSDATCYIYESGTSVASLGSWSTGDVFVVLYDGVHVSYYRNGALARVTNAAAGLTLFLDSSFYEVNTTLSNIRFGPQTSISAVTAAAAAAALTATWTGVTNAPQDTSNMVRTPTFDGLASVRTWDAGTVATVSGQPFTGALSTTARDTVETLAGVPVTAGETLWFAAWMNASSATAAFNFGGEFHNSTGIVGWIPGVSRAAGAAGWAYVVGSLVVPAGSTMMYPWVQLNGTSGSVGTGLITMMYAGRAQPGANNTYVDVSGTIQGVASGAGAAVANSLLTAPIAAAATTAVWSSVSSTPANLTALAGTEAIQNSLVTVGGRNIITRAVEIACGGSPATDYYGGTNAVSATLAASGSYRLTPFTVHDVGAYSISFWIKATVATSVEFDICDNVNHTVAVTTAWQFVKVEGEYNASSYLNTTYFGFLDFVPTAACTLTISNLMVEFANKASAWSPAPEDVSSGIASAATTAQWSGVSSTPANLTALSGTEAIQNTGVTINGSGQIVGIGSGSGTAVSNSLLTASISDKLSASAGGVLSSTISLGATAGAGFVAGTLTWNSAGARTGGTGVAMTPGGLLGTDSSGNVTFSINASTGAATFGGTLTAAGIVATANLATGSVCQLRNTAYNSALSTSLTVANTVAQGTQSLTVLVATSSYTTYCYGAREIVLTGCSGSWSYTLNGTADSAHELAGGYWRPGLYVRRVVNGVATVIWSTDYTGTPDGSFGYYLVGGGPGISEGIGTLPTAGSSSDITILDDTSLGSPGTAVTLYYDLCFGVTLYQRASNASTYTSTSTTGVSFPALPFPGQRFISMVEYQK